MMVEPTINWTDFLKDLDQGMSAYNLQAKYTLTPRQYRWIMRRIIRKDGFSRKATGLQRKKIHRDFHDTYISIRKDAKGFLIRKNNVYYGNYETLEIARKVKKKLIECNWDKSKLNDIRKELGLKPMRNYNGYNDKKT